MQNVPGVILFLFSLVVIFAIRQFYVASHKSGKILAFLIVYAFVQSLLGIYGFYKVAPTAPPRLIFLIGPGLFIAAGLCFFDRGKLFLDGLDLKSLTLLHTVRLPVEIVLYYVYRAGLIPELMTFEGFNFDILSGISAFGIYYLVFINKRAGYKSLLIWNVICLLLLINIVSIALLSAKSPFQQLAFDQPNIGITYFPLVLLPGVVVPLVLVAHIAAIRQLVFKK